MAADLDGTGVGVSAKRLSRTARSTTSFAAPASRSAVTAARHWVMNSSVALDFHASSTQP
jgi:hypothetical protein